MIYLLVTQILCSGCEYEVAGRFATFTECHDAARSKMFAPRYEYYGCAFRNDLIMPSQFKRRWP